MVRFIWHIRINTEGKPYDTQKIKSIYMESDGTAVAEKKAIMGALTLYLDFINMFIFMLHLFGNRE